MRKEASTNSTPEKVVEENPAEDPPPVFSRREDSDRPRGPARRREHRHAVPERGPGAESLLPLEQGVSRSREEAAGRRHEPGGDRARGH